MILKALEKLDVKPLRGALGVNTDVFGIVAETTSRTVERWEKKGHVPEDAPPSLFVRLSKIQEIIKLGILVYGPENFKVFLRSPLPAFEGKTAIQMMLVGNLDRVLVAVATDYEGGGY